MKILFAAAEYSLLKATKLKHEKAEKIECANKIETKLCNIDLAIENKTDYKYETKYRIIISINDSHDAINIYVNQDKCCFIQTLIQNWREAIITIHNNRSLSTHHCDSPVYNWLSHMSTPSPTHNNLIIISSAMS